MKKVKSVQQNGTKEITERKSSRFRTIFTGKIRQDGKTKDCLIMDVSARGARLKNIKNLSDTPEIHLIIDRLGPYRAIEGEIMWRSGDFVGVNFLADAEDMKEKMAELMPSRWSLSKDSR